MKRRTAITIAGVVLFLCIIFYLSYRVQYQDSPRLRSRERALMGTVFSLKIADPLSHEDFVRVTDGIFTEIARLEQVMSEYIPDSPISRAAALAGKISVSVPDDVLAVLDCAHNVSETTGGAFDITFKPLGKLWDVTNRVSPPAEDAVQRARSYVDYHRVRIDHEHRLLFLEKSGMAIGLGGIAKGFAARRAATMLRSAGIENFIINAGGDLFFSGRKGDAPWTCGVRNPVDPAHLIRRFSILSDCAVATSGDYEKYFIYEGIRYHHIINPRTGYPARGMKSVTVFAGDPAVADAYATAFFILGIKKASAIVSTQPDLAFVMIDDDNRIHTSETLDTFAEEIPLASGVPR